MLCSLTGEPDGASSTTSPRSRCAIYTDQGSQRHNVPDQRGQLYYLLVTDYHYKVYLVEEMHSTTSTEIANKSVQWFSMLVLLHGSMCGSTNLPFSVKHVRTFTIHAPHAFFKGTLYGIWCGVNKLGDSGVKVV